MVANAATSMSRGLPVNVFICWLRGNDTAGYPALRRVSSADVSRVVRDAAQRFSDYRYLMKQFEKVIELKLKPAENWKDNALVPQIRSMHEQAVQPAQPTPKNRTRRSTELAWTTLVKLWRKYMRHHDLADVVQ